MKEAWSFRGNALHQLCRFNDAIKSFDRAIAIDDHFIDPLQYKGNALGRLNRYKEAVEMYDKVLAIDKKNKNKKVRSIRI